MTFQKRPDRQLLPRDLITSKTVTYKQVSVGRCGDRVRHFVLCGNTYIYGSSISECNVLITAQRHSHTVAKMRFSLAALALPVAANAAQYSSAEYASGQVHMKLMQTKTVRIINTNKVSPRINLLIHLCRSNGITMQPKENKTLANGNLGRA